MYYSNPPKAYLCDRFIGYGKLNQITSSITIKDWKGNLISKLPEKVSVQGWVQLLPDDSVLSLILNLYKKHKIVDFKSDNKKYKVRVVQITYIYDNKNCWYARLVRDLVRDGDTLNYCKKLVLPYKDLKDIAHTS